MGFKEMRLAANLSVLDVQKAMNISDATIYYWESGKTRPTVNNLLKLAELYGCSVDDLLKKGDADAKNKT